MAWYTSTNQSRVGNTWERADETHAFSWVALLIKGVQLFPSQGSGSKGEQSPSFSLKEAPQLPWLCPWSKQMVEKEQIGNHYVPVPLTPLLGREQEVAEVSTLLRASEIRLLTLTGTGGVGKTHLALNVVHQVCNDFADGVSFVSLAPVRDPDLLLSALAHTLGLRETGSQALLEQLIGYLHSKHLLLFLDNFEQLMQAAPTLTALLERCPQLKLLVTSREVLQVRGEHVYLVRPLPFPDPGQLAAGGDPFRYASIVLFLQRAQAVKRPPQYAAMEL